MHISLYKQLENKVLLQDLETVDNKQYPAVTKSRFEQIRREFHADESANSYQDNSGGFPTQEKRHSDGDMGLLELSQ